MSKIAFISDIHGNFPALLATWADIEKRKISSIICLGDLVGYYCQINEVIDFIRTKGIITIMGNHDYALTHNNGCIPRSKTCTNVLQQQLSYITKQNFNYLETLPYHYNLFWGSSHILCLHGGMNNPIDEYITNISNDYFSSIETSITHVVTGHTHIPQIKTLSQILYANSGSIGQPRDFNPQSSYLIFEDGAFTIARVEYPINEISRRMKLEGYPDYISEVLYRGCRIGE